MKRFECDFHIHTTLSPCSSLEMSPRNIVLQAKAKGLDIIAVTDHNMAENGSYVANLGKQAGLIVLFGMELQTLEEIHLLVIFDTYSVALGFQEEMYNLLPDVKNDADYFGDQVVVDEEDNIVRFEERLLLNSAQISLDEAVARVKTLGGLVIPSHIDSPTYSVISQLGFVPDALPFDALEVRNSKTIESLLPFIFPRHIPFVFFSDAHYLKDIGIRRTVLLSEDATIEGIGAALQQLAKDGTGSSHVSK